MSFLAPPPWTDTMVFTCLTDRFRRARPGAWGKTSKSSATVDSFLRSFSFDRRGRLRVTDISHGCLLRISFVGGTGEWHQVTEYGGWPDRLKNYRDGGITLLNRRATR